MEPPPLPPPPRFKLHFSAWILWGVGSLVIIGSTFLKAGPVDPLEWSRRFGMAMGLLLFPSLIAWITWRASRRSRTAAIAAFFIVFGLDVVGLLLPVLSRGVNAIADRANAALIEAAGIKYQAHLGAAKQRYDTANLQADTDHILNFAWLTAKDQIAPRRTAMQEAVVANRAFRQTVIEGDSNFRQALEQVGMPAGTTEQAVAEFHHVQRAKLPLLIKIRDMDEKMFMATLTLLDLLEAQWGHWSRQNGQMSFEDDAAIEKFNAALGEVRAAAKEQADCQKQLGMTGT